MVCRHKKSFGFKIKKGEPRGSNPHSSSGDQSVQVAVFQTGLPVPAGVEPAFAPGWRRPAN